MQSDCALRYFLIDKQHLCCTLFDSRFHHDDRLNSTGIGRCDIDIIPIHIHSCYNLGLQLAVRRIHLFCCCFRDTQQENFTICHIIAVLIQRIISFYICQSQCTVRAFSAGFTHQKRTCRQIFCCECNLIAADKGSRSGRHRQHHVILTINLLFGKNARTDDALIQIDRTSLSVSATICTAARRIVDNAPSPRRMVQSTRTPYRIERVAVLKHLDSGVQCQCLRCT